MASSEMKWAKTGTQEALPEHQETVFHYEGK